jgi:hypothetical protein
MKRLLFIFLMMTCSVSWAEWEYTGETDNRTDYHDKSTIRINGAFAKMWMIRNYSSVQTESGKRFKSEKAFFVYNCREEKYELISIIAYADSMGAGDVVFSATKKEHEWEFSPVSPGSSGATLFKIACGK